MPFVIRVALTVILIAGAPIALMFHALPQTEHTAYWWWKAFGGCLAIQVVQSLTLITAMRVFLAPAGFTLFGPTSDGLVNLLVACSLMYILYKIPFWVLGSIRGGGGGRSFVGSLVRGFIAYKNFGLISGRGGGSGGGAARAARARAAGGRTGTGDAAPDPYANLHATSDGQYMLPLPGVRRSRPDRTPAPASAAGSRAGQGRQLALPLGEDWPENRPVLGRDGQYRLPLDVTRSPRPGHRRRRRSRQVHPRAVGHAPGRSWSCRSTRTGATAPSAPGNTPCPSGTLPGPGGCQGRRRRRPLRCATVCPASWSCRSTRSRTTPRCALASTRSRSTTWRPSRARRHRRCLPPPPGPPSRRAAPTPAATCPPAPAARRGATVPSPPPARAPRTPSAPHTPASARSSPSR